MKRPVLMCYLALWALLSAGAQTASDHLSPEEVTAALASGGVGVAYMIDNSVPFTDPDRCNTRFASKMIYTPAGWLRSLALGDKKQFLPFAPGPMDTLRALTVVSSGCVGSEPGPHCDSITRVVLLSDKNGTQVVEASTSFPMNSSWQNGFGATASCASLVSKFKLSDVQRIRNAKGEFLIATFSGVTMLKTYVVKEKYVKDLGPF